MWMKILLNAINVIGTGAQVVVRNILSTMPVMSPEDSFVAILPDGFGYETLATQDNLQTHYIPRSRYHILSRLEDLYVNIPNWCRKFDVDACFTLGDIGPAKLPVPQVVLLHQPWIVYREPQIEAQWPYPERWKLWYSRWQFRQMMRHCAAVFVQTPVMASRMRQLYGVAPKKVHVILQTVPEHVQVMASKKVKPNNHMIEVDKPCRLLFLAAGYEHKNHSILPALVQKLRQRGLADLVHIFVTLDPAARKYEHHLLDSLASHSDCVTNLGRLKMNQVPGAYAAAHALFMPTLVESFGLIYLEAMVNGCPILTSDRDFARWMCQDLALYFDPLDPVSIVDTLECFLGNGSPSSYKTRTAERLSGFPDSWDSVAQQYLDVIR